VELNDDVGGSESASDGGGYLASAITDRTGAGSARCPWLLRASPWQRINVTLIDFSDSATLDDGKKTFGYSVVHGETADTARTGHANGLNVNDVEVLNPPIDIDRRHHQDAVNNRDDQRHTGSDGKQLQELHLRTFCHKYAVVREHQSSSSRETVVCGDKARRKVVYLSASNEIEVELIRPTSNDDDDQISTKQPAVFLLRYDSQTEFCITLTVCIMARLMYMCVCMYCMYM